MILVSFDPEAAGADETIGCPTREAVGVAVHALLSQSRVDPRSVETTIEVQDLGERYVVTVKGRTREYTDEAHDCARRARVAAVFVALTLAPPDIALPELKPMARAEPTAPPPKPEPEPRPRAEPTAAPHAWWPEAGRWFQTEACLRAAADATGQLTVWFDGTLVFDVAGQAVMPSSYVAWNVGAVAEVISPAPATLYVDDAAISSERLGPSYPVFWRQ
jgi:hypothetical protein